MPRTTIAFVAAMLLTILAAPFAMAEGLNLSWDDCGSGGAALKSFACNTNTATFTLVGSLIRDAPDSVLAVGGTLLIESETATLPDWWKFPDSNPNPNPPGACQDSGLLVVDDGQSTSCPTLIIDPVSGFSYSWFPVTNQPNQAILNFSTGSSSLSGTFLEPGTEYAYFRLIIHPTKTTGPDACAGCSTPMTLTLSRGVLVRLGTGENHTITQPATRNVVTWDGGPTPALRSTWGAIKRLYR